MHFTTYSMYSLELRTGRKTCYFEQLNTALGCSSYRGFTAMYLSFMGVKHNCTDKYSGTSLVPAPLELDKMLMERMLAVVIVVVVYRGNAYDGK